MRQELSLQRCLRNKITMDSGLGPKLQDHGPQGTSKISFRPPKTLPRASNSLQEGSQRGHIKCQNITKSGFRMLPRVHMHLQNVSKTASTCHATKQVRMPLWGMKRRQKVNSKLVIWKVPVPFTYHIQYLFQPCVLVERKKHLTSLPEAAAVWFRFANRGRHKLMTPQHISVCNQLFGLQAKTTGRARPTHPGHRDQACPPCQLYQAVWCHTWCRNAVLPTAFLGLAEHAER